MHSKVFDVLLIAPDLQIPLLQEEARSVSRILHAVTLQGEVTRKDVIEMLREQEWDILWFASHGSSEGILLSDGYLPTADLTALVRSSKAELVFLNTCSSRTIALELFYELRVSVVSTEAEIDDRTALQTSILFAESLAAGAETYRTAFERSKPGQGKNYFFLDGGDNSEREETHTILLLNQWGATLSAKLDRLEEQWFRELKRLNTQVLLMENELHRLKRFPTRHRIMFGIAFFLLLAALLLSFSQIQTALNLQWGMAVALATIFYLISSVIWSLLWWGEED